LVLCGSAVECFSIEDCFKKYSKNLAGFRTAVICNARPVPCEVYRLQSNPCVIISTIKRFLKVSKIYPITVQYLWIDQLPDIIKLNSSTKVLN
jgi:hypothetical protein